MLFTPSPSAITRSFRDIFSGFQPCVLPSKDSRYLTTLKGTRSEIILPIKVDGSVIGTIDVESEALNAFPEKLQKFLEKCAIAAVPLWESSA